MNEDLKLALQAIVGVAILWAFLWISAATFYAFGLT